jgi:hypothetical protein
MFQMLAFVPTADDEDEAWRPWHCRPSHASPRYFKLEDRRVFEQRGGWPIVSGKSSPIRARKVRR